jgi:hypothetical protein
LIPAAHTTEDIPLLTFGLTADTGAAFGGINPNVGSMFMNYPMGRSVYNGLQSEWRNESRIRSAVLKSLDLQVNYTLSRFVSDGGSDQHFTSNCLGLPQPHGLYGPHVGGSHSPVQVRRDLRICSPRSRLSLIGGFASPQPSDLRLPTQGTVGEIFRSDVTGDGTTGDFLNSAATGIGHPGTFARSVSPKNLNAYITNFNNTVGNGTTLTPAGQALVTAGLFTQAELISLGAVVPSVQLPPASNAGNGYYKDVDTIVSWPFKFRERVTISPSISFFNTFNFANLGPLSGLAAGGGANVETL